MKKKEFDMENFGPLLPLINTKTVTDIVWTGRDLRYIDNITGPHVSDIQLSKNVVDSLIAKISDFEDEPINYSHPALEAETETLRITCIHQSINSMGNRIQLRASYPELMIKDPIGTNYVHPLLWKLIGNLIKLRSGSLNSGDTGAGKTELTKALVQFMDKNDPIVTIEDSYELKLNKIPEYSEYDFTCFKINSKFSYKDAHKEMLRLNAKWGIFTEVRADEIALAIGYAMTGCGTNTSIHVPRVQDIPARIRGMIGYGTNARSLLNDFYTSFDFAVHIKADKINGKYFRRIDQLCIFDRDEENDKNTITMIYDNEKFTGNNLPQNIISKLKGRGLENPLNDYLVEGKVIVE